MGQSSRPVVITGVPIMVTLSCGHKVMFNIAPPRIGDLILCYSHNAPATIVLREPLINEGGSQ